MNPAPGYPILLDLRGRLAVVVGLGPVGRRKAAGLLAAGARVRGVDPRAAPWADTERDQVEPGPGGEFEVHAEAYRPAHLDGASLAVAAATPEVNEAVVRDARARGVWVASSSDPGAGDWTAPAVHRDGPITLAVSTGGASPALAGALRDRLAEALGPEAGALARLLLDLRAEAVAAIADPEVRRLALRRAGDPAWLVVLAERGAEEARRAIRAALGLP